MKKDYNYYYESGGLFSIISLILLLIAVAPSLIHFNIPDTSMIIVSTIRITFGVVGGGFAMLSIIYQNKQNDIRIKERQLRKKKALNDIVILVRDSKSQEAIDAIYDYDNKYN